MIFLLAFVSSKCWSYKSYNVNFLFRRCNHWKELYECYSLCITRNTGLNKEGKQTKKVVTLVTLLPILKGNLNQRFW